MKHDDFLRKHPVFTAGELAEHLAKHGEVRARTREALLAYYKKTGRVVAVRRGLYAVVPPGSDPESYPIDPFLIAAKLTPDAVLSHHTALEYLNRAYSVFEQFVYSAARPLGRFNFRGRTFRGVRFSKALRSAGLEMFGVLSSERAGLQVHVTSFERTLVDVLDRPDVSGSWEEIWRSLESVEFFDLDRAVEYALLLQNATTAAKLGFFLDQHRESLMIEDRHLEPLHKLRPRQPHYLDRSRRQPGRLVSRWNLVVPVEVLDRVWDEVL